MLAGVPVIGGNIDDESGDELMADDAIDEPSLIAEDIIDEPSLIADDIIDEPALMAEDAMSLDDEVDELDVLDALPELLVLEPQAASVSVAAAAAARIPAMRGRSTISPSDRK